MVFIVMGVAGCGKTTVAKMLSEQLGWRYIEGDEYHPKENVDKMSAGIPLNDDDRSGWLQSLRNEIEKTKAEGSNAVITCSALKAKYRDILRNNDADVFFIHLKGTYDDILARMQKRTGHYFKPAMLQSQFDALEEPADAFTIDAMGKAAELVAQVIEEFKLEVKK